MITITNSKHDKISVTTVADAISIVRVMLEQTDAEIITVDRSIMKVKLGPMMTD